MAEPSRDAATPAPEFAGGPVQFTGKGIRRGARATLPMFVGLAPFGLVVGVLSAAKGLSLAEAMLMSALVYAGSSQLLALELWTEPAPILAAMLATVVVNIRLAPMGAALAPWLDRLRGWRLWGTLATMVDHSFAMSIAEIRSGGRDAGFLLGVGLALYAGWLIFVGAGHVLGGAVRLAPGHPLFFAGAATFTALLVPLWRGARADFLPWALSAAVALLCFGLGLPQPVPLLGGALSGALLGAFLELRRAARTPPPS